MHLGMPECHKPFLGHCDLDLWPNFQELLCPEHIFYIVWCRNPNFGVVIPLGMAEWCIPFWVTLTLTLTSGLISRFLVLYYSYLSSNVSYARSIPLGAFVTCLWHFLLVYYLVNFDQTCIDTSYWFWPYFQGHSGTLKCFCTLSSEQVGGFWPNLHRYIIGVRRKKDQILVTLTWFSRSHWPFEMSKIGFLCVIIWTSGWILTNLHRYIVGRWRREDQILVTLT